MPEIPEIRFIREYLINNNYIDLRVIKIYDNKNDYIINNNDDNLLNTNKIVNINSKGKLLWLELDNETYVHIHFGLGGEIGFNIQGLKYIKYSLKIIIRL